MREIPTVHEGDGGSLPKLISDIENAPDSCATRSEPHIYGSFGSQKKECIVTKSTQLLVKVEAPPVTQGHRHNDKA